MNLKQNEELKNIKWSQALPEVLDAAIAEYKKRQQLAEKLAVDHDQDMLKKLYYGTPVTFPQKKHAAKIALEENTYGV